MNAPQRSAEQVQLASGVLGIAPGIAFIEATRTLVTADTHLGYEDAIEAALPAWSTDEVIAALLVSIHRTQARELAILGDIVHSSRLSEGAARRVRAGIEALRAACDLILVRGNHEGGGGARELIGDAARSAQRGGWHLVHGDVPAIAERTFIGHLHPSVGGRETVPAFLHNERFIVLPALTPYSSGLRVNSQDCVDALRSFGVERRSAICVTGCSRDRLYPFGSLSNLQTVLRNSSRAPVNRFRRQFLRPDR